MSKQPKNFRIKKLHSGGIITNYYCTSACGHCLYNCSPRWQKEYIDKQTLRKILRTTKRFGCHAVHIGGGEPFLHLDGLKMVIEEIHSLCLNIEYVETNSSWYQGRETAVKTLRSLKESGLSTLLISISPFHNEHIPFFKVKGVMEACREAKMNMIPWIAEFYPEIDAFDDRVTHHLSEYMDKYGGNYLLRIPSRYWIHLGGRALKTFARVFGTKKCSDILATNTGGCRELLDVSHFHFDLYGNYVPGLCSGLAIKCEDLGESLPEREYPFLTTLYQNGIAGFYEQARSEYGYKPSREYLTKCDLCLDIRQHLVLQVSRGFRELQPVGHYQDL